jgi:hypothetical protein
MRCAKCDRTATHIYPLTGAAVCGNHAAALRNAAVTLIENAEQIVARLAASYLPEMREHDLGMLARIVDQVIPDDERVDIRIHLAARKAAAHVALEERRALIVA